MQLVHLVEGGERASMSKRRGEFVTLDELIDEIGVDATRCFMLARSHDTTIDLDLDLAREQSSENPVYYVQYAHARIAVDPAQGRRGAGRRGARPTRPRRRRRCTRPSARWSRSCSAFPDEVAEAAERRAPHRIAAYALELAQDFTAFYRDCQVVGAEPAALEACAPARSASPPQRTIAPVARPARRHGARRDVNGRRAAAGAL